ncbi:hypothetical protein IJM86_01850 [bacterium]|nr:hypothetical protein [bacterium]
MKSLPNDSFNFIRLKEIPDSFFAGFNEEGALLSLPDFSFETSKIEKV